MRVGQEVVVTESRAVKDGARGFVFTNDENKRRDTVGVFLTTPVRRGHDLDGRVPEGHGIWLSPDQLIEVLD